MNTNENINTLQTAISGNVVSSDVANEVDVTQSRTSPSLVEKFVIRLPKGLRDQIKELSEHHRRSMNSEIIMVLEQHIQQSIDAMRENLGDNELETSTQDLDEYQDKILNQKLQDLPEDKKLALLSLLD